MKSAAAFERARVWIAVGAICISSSSLFGCASFQYDGVAYPSRITAVEAARRDVQIGLDHVKPEGESLPGRAVVILPSRSRLQEKGVVKMGAASGEQVAYVVDVLEVSFQVMGQAVQRSQLFDSVELLTADDPASQRPPHDWIIWLHIQDQNTVQWYLRRQDSTDGTPIPVNTGVDRHLRAAAWVRTVRSAAVELSQGRFASSRDGTDSGSSMVPDSQSNQVGSGTAFAVARGGYFLTNHHVISDCREVTSSPAGERIRFTVVALDAENDLAVLKGAFATDPVAFAARSPRQGSRVVAVGFPLKAILGTSATTTEGVVSNLSGPRNDSRFFQVSTPVQPGSSGGPVFDEAGRVVGVIVSKLDALRIAIATGDIPQNVNFAIKAAVVTSFLDAHQVEYDVLSGERLSTADISDVGQRTTIAIDCWR